MKDGEYRLVKKFESSSSSFNNLKLNTIVQIKKDDKSWDNYLSVYENGKWVDGWVPELLAEYFEPAHKQFNDKLDKLLGE